MKKRSRRGGPARSAQERSSRDSSRSTSTTVCRGTRGWTMTVFLRTCRCVGRRRRRPIGIDALVHCRSAGHPRQQRRVCRVHVGHGAGFGEHNILSRDFVNRFEPDGAGPGTVVPEPSTRLLTLTGLGAIVALSRRKRNTFVFANTRTRHACLSPDDARGDDAGRRRRRPPAQSTSVTVRSSDGSA